MRKKYEALVTLPSVTFHGPGFQGHIIRVGQAIMIGQARELPHMNSLKMGKKIRSQERPFDLSSRSRYGDVAFKIHVYVS